MSKTELRNVAADPTLCVDVGGRAFYFSPPSGGAAARCANKLFQEAV